MIPLAVVLFSVFSETNEVWLHFVQTSLVTLLINTFWLLLGVGCRNDAFLGVSLAWLTAACDFPGRKWLDWALMLPLSLPPYVVAFVASVCSISPVRFKRSCECGSAWSGFGFRKSDRPAGLSP
ncbi:MAG: hypothetical protein MPW15_09785 [Candidatus Manganitrophus sp.]|nr:hypothetical protein [Candidatus Manganitrophus sp.]